MAAIFPVGRTRVRWLDECAATISGLLLPWDAAPVLNDVSHLPSGVSGACITARSVLHLPERLALNVEHYQTAHPVGGSIRLERLEAQGIYLDAWLSPAELRLYQIDGVALAALISTGRIGFCCELSDVIVRPDGWLVFGRLTAATLTTHPAVQ